VCNWHCSPPHIPSSLINRSALYYHLLNLLVLIEFVLALVFIHRKTIRQKSHSEIVIFIILLLALLIAWLCEIVGITALIGAFGVGCIIPRSGNLVQELTTKIEDLIVIVFMPIFFTVSGLRTQIGLVDTGNLWGLTLLITSVSCLAKITGTALPTSSSHSKLK